MDGGSQKRTRQPGHVMFHTHQLEVRDAKHKKTRESQPPTAPGDRPAVARNDSELIAQSKRPSFLQLLSALWGAEEELRRRRGGKVKSKRPRATKPEPEEKP